MCVYGCGVGTSHTLGKHSAAEIYSHTPRDSFLNKRHGFYILNLSDLFYDLTSIFLSNLQTSRLRLGAKLPLDKYQNSLISRWELIDIIDGDSIFSNGKMLPEYFSLPKTMSSNKCKYLE